jgi:hypothetical protein
VTDEQRHRIVEQAHEHLQRLADLKLERHSHRPQWKVPEPPRRGLDTAPAPAPPPVVDVTAAIEAAITDERERTTELLAELLAYIQREFAFEVRKLREERSDAKAELVEETRRLRIELAELQTVVGELRQALAHERGKPLDLPSPPAARRVN